jgi:hypothetical protein
MSSVLIVADASICRGVIENSYQTTSLTRFGHITITGRVLSLFDATNKSDSAATSPYIWPMPKVQKADAPRAHRAGCARP